MYSHNHFHSHSSLLSGQFYISRSAAANTDVPICQLCLPSQDIFYRRLWKGVAKSIRQCQQAKEKPKVLSTPSVASVYVGLFTPVISYGFSFPLSLVPFVFCHEVTFASTTLFTDNVFETEISKCCINTRFMFYVTPF